MANNSYVLAMYDVRGKQDYIFRGSKLKEIVGGSLVIRDIFEDELFPAAKEFAYRKKLESIAPSERERTLKTLPHVIYSYKHYGNTAEARFSQAGFERRMQEGWLGEVVYDGGGNFFILYRDKETYLSVNKIFTRRVLMHTCCLTVLCSCIEGVNFENYTTLISPKFKGTAPKGDREKLYLENRKREAYINPQMPAQVLPFTQVDYRNSLPLSGMIRTPEGVQKVTREALRKYEKYEEAKAGDDTLSEKILDKIVRDKGADSWIAVIYIDGNNMGAKVQNLFGGSLLKSDFQKISYEDAVEKLRRFSNQIQKDYIDDRIAAIDTALMKKYGEKDYKRRLVVHAGDEINIILNAHDAYDAVKAYFRDMPKTGSACAGIAIFKSHTPYSDAYRIAEQCCEVGKQHMKRYGMKEVNLVDFHYCQGIIGMDIEDIRAREVGDIISKPWFIGFDSTQKGDMPLRDVITCEMVDEMAQKLNTCTRTNIKGLLDCARNSESELFTELTRMQLRRKGGNSLPDITELDGKAGKLSRSQLRKLIYDIVSVYDLWFREEER